MAQNRCITVVAALLLLLTLASGFSSSPHPFANPVHISKVSQSESYYRPILFADFQNGNGEKPISRRQKIWKRSKKTFAILALTLGYFGTPLAAMAARPVVNPSFFKGESIKSIKPGTVIRAVPGKDFGVLEERELVKSVEVEDDYDDEDYGDEYEEDDEEDSDEDFEIELSKKPVQPTYQVQGANVYQRKLVVKKNYVKGATILGSFVLTGFLALEAYKRTGESSYMKKAIKIQAIKKKQWEAKLKEDEEKAKSDAAAGIEPNEDEDEDDEEDEDEEDENDEDDAEDEENKEDDITPPKEPSSGGGDDDGSDDSDDGSPNAEDVARLNKLMGR